jgi:arginyl-tRNA synthetase
MLRDDLARDISVVLGAESGVHLTKPERRENGDWSTNAPFLLAKKLSRKPDEIAADAAAKLSESSKMIERAEAKGGFLNIFVKDEVLIKTLSAKTEFPVKKEKINIEFVSANPTGPLTMANGRGGFYGDALATILRKVGYNVTREFYINDSGNQVRLLGESIEAAEGKREAKEEYYKGEYVKTLAGKNAEEAVQTLLVEIKLSLKKAGIEFDTWFSEQKLREQGELEKVLKFLESKGLLDEKDDAIWLGDAVLIKSDGEPTYFLSDLAYHYDKFLKRQFDIAIDVWGADHHGYVDRMKKGIAALGINPERLKIIIMQLVRLMQGGTEVRMSKRAGEFVTMDELLEEVGVDAARWFFLERGANTHMDFDLDLAKEKSEKNPVYYVQYAHTRMASILQKSTGTASPLKVFKNEVERELALKILRYPEILDDISRDYGVQRLTSYAYELAQAFSAFYRDVKVIGSDREAELLYLVLKTKETLADVLETLGISRPEKM